jgi:putative nucleotidyltransferase with HDIG domain
MLTRDQALRLLADQGLDQQLTQHSLEAEAVLTALARRLGQDQELWGLTGLLHDLDYPQTKDAPERHGLLSATMLQGQLPDEAVAAIRRHNGERNGNPPETAFDFALRCGETVTGLIHANALVRPEGMAGMKPKSLKKKMKEKAFAAAVCRETILECEKIPLPLDEFFQLAIEAVDGIKEQVGLR